MTEKGRLEAPLGAVLRSERDGITFYRRASAIAADPRVRQLFERLARQREDVLGALQTAVEAAGIRPASAAGPSPYPFEAVSKVECYACGYAAEEIPGSCPSCGAARYAFEKEFRPSMAWEIAVSAGKAEVAGIEAAVPLAEGPLRSALEKVLVQERAQLREAEGKLASAKA